MSSNLNSSSTSLNQNNCIPQVLNALNHQVLLVLLSQQYATYSVNPHSKAICVVMNHQEMDRSSFTLSVLKQFSFLYYKVFVKYFMFVLLQQFE